MFISKRPARYWVSQEQVTITTKNAKKTFPAKGSRRYHRWHDQTRSSKRFLISCIANALSIRHPVISMQRYLTKESIGVPREPCTVFLKSMAKCVKEETSYSDPITRNRSFWQRLLIRYGRGISQNSKDLQSGPISICMSFSISSAVTWLAGWLRTVNRPYWHNDLSPIAVKNKLSSRNNW